ncbi:anti-sigma factor [Persicirhabdus sediminis]|uniref:Uncharacterized protein n=1 Tax=Persicirhabdus sediminis TaxID=454144 RepID=A0A8J7MG05_9BACT|nr:hypothetical protein [Persicirhabdus sediminis]MBK1792342.1 hypothetical protein [Persicirhabdus sediminis]
MKNHPDEILITRWIDDDLTGAELEQMNAWVAEHPELLEEKQAIRAMQAELRSELPRSVEPEHPVSFNAGILAAIEQENLARPAAATSTPASPAEPEKVISIWRYLRVPAIAAGMTVAFLAGSKINQPESAGSELADAQPAAKAPVPLTFYTPDSDVAAHYQKTKEATVVVIDGLEEIPRDSNIVQYHAGPKPDAIMAKNSQ